MLQSNAIRRAGLRCAGRAVQARSMASLASFKTPAVFNEPNVGVFQHLFVIPAANELDSTTTPRAVLSVLA